MDRAVILIPVFALFTGIMPAQSVQLIIKHTGMADAAIFPRVFTTAKITDEFSGKYLRMMHDRVKVELPAIQQCILVADSVIMMANECQAFIRTVDHSTPFEDRFGSCEFLMIKDDSMHWKYEVNDLDLTLEILGRLRTFMMEKGYQDGPVEFMDRLIQRFEPPTDVHIIPSAGDTSINPFVDPVIEAPDLTYGKVRRMGKVDKKMKGLMDRLDYGFTPYLLPDGRYVLLSKKDTVMVVNRSRKDFIDHFDPGREHIRD